MKMFSVAVMSGAVLTGLAGAGVAYEIASAGDPPAATSVTPTAPADAAKPRKRWAPCEPPAVLEGKTCVTDVVRTVVLPAAAGAQIGAAQIGSFGDASGTRSAAFADDGHGRHHDAFDDHDHDHDHDGDRDDRDDWDDREDWEDWEDWDAFDDHGGDRDDRDDDHDDWDDDHSGSGSGDDDSDFDDRDFDDDDRDD